MSNDKYQSREQKHSHVSPKEQERKEGLRSETKVQISAMFWLNKAQACSHVVISSLQLISGVTLLSQVHCKMSPGLVTSTLHVSSPGFTRCQIHTPSPLSPAQR